MYFHKIWLRLAYKPWNQSHYREVPRWEIVMEQELRLLLKLGQLALLKKKKIWANYEQILRPVFHVFMGKKVKKYMK